MLPGTDMLTSFGIQLEMWLMTQMSGPNTTVKKRALPDGPPHGMYSGHQR